jgi:hypothetical protein
MRCINTLFILFVSAASLVGCERYALDRQMEELCKKDGGIKVYETVTLSSAEYEALSKYVVTKTSMDEYYGPDYRYVQKRELLVGTENGPQKGRGRLSRWYEALYRKSDERLLGESIEYFRTGGDMFTLGFQPSANYCPKPRSGLSNLVFVKGE